MLANLETHRPRTEEGLTVYGFGEQKTPKPFVAACDKFVYIELLREDAPTPSNDNILSQSAAPAENSAPETQIEESKKPKAPVGFIAKILDDIADEDGWAHLGALGANITKLRPDFDPRTHGYKKLSDLIKSYPHAFELQARGASGGTAVMYARHKHQNK